MAFYFLFFGVLAFYDLVPPARAAITALAGVYGLAFFSLVASYFWARWYSVGVGLFGVSLAVLGIWQLPPEQREVLLPTLLFFGGTHLATALLLWGDAMSEPYDGQTTWRQKFHMDDNAVHRLGRSVIRAGMSLPFILLYAFPPRTDPGALAAFVLVAVGLRGLIRLRTWGVLAIGAAGGLTLALVGADALSHGLGPWLVRPALAGGMLLAAVAPFLRPVLRFVVAA